MEGKPNARYAIKKCTRHDDDGTKYALTFLEPIILPFQIIQQIEITQSQMIEFNQMASRLKYILPMSERWIEIWETTRQENTHNWRIQPNYEVRSGLRRAIVSIIYYQDEH